MKKPEPISVKCPTCGKCILQLSLKETEVKLKNGDIVKSDWWVYICENCKSSFTTTKSDEISLKNMKANNPSLDFWF